MPEIKNDTGLITHDPSIVPGPGLKGVSWPDQHLPAIGVLHSNPALDDVSDLSFGRTYCLRTGMFRPLPTRQVFAYPYSRRL
jgi:hypothetical protein